MISPRNEDDSGTLYGVSGPDMVRATLTNAQDSGALVLVDNLGYTSQ